jgi:hypothetical protein
LIVIFGLTPLYSSTGKSQIVVSVQTWCSICRKIGVNISRKFSFVHAELLMKCNTWLGSGSHFVLAKRLMRVEKGSHWFELQLWHWSLWNRSTGRWNSYGFCSYEFVQPRCSHSVRFTGQWTVTVTNGWDFCLLEGSAIKLLLLQEGKEFWFHESFFEYFRMNYETFNNIFEIFFLLLLKCRIYFFIATYLFGITVVVVFVLLSPKAHSL